MTDGSLLPLALGVGIPTVLLGIPLVIWTLRAAHRPAPAEADSATVIAESEQEDPPAIP